MRAQEFKENFVKKLCDQPVVGGSFPSVYDLVELFYTIKFFIGKDEKYIFSSSLLHDNPVSISLGESEILWPIEEAVKGMTTGEKSIFETNFSNSSYLYLLDSHNLLGDLDIKNNGCCQIEIVLIKISPRRDIMNLNLWDIPDCELLKVASKLKELGNTELMSKNYKTAVEYYDKGILLLKNNVEKEPRDLVILLKLNKAQALLKLQEYSEAVSECNSIIDTNFYVSKAYYRKACGLVEQECFDEAKKVLKEAILLFENEEFSQKLNETIMLEKKAELQEKRLYAQMLK